MKEFFRVLRRFVPPYKKYLVLNVIFNILSAILNIFSFASLQFVYLLGRNAYSGLCVFSDWVFVIVELTGIKFLEL